MNFQYCNEDEDADPFYHISKLSLRSKELKYFLSNLPPDPVKNVMNDQIKLTRIDIFLLQNGVRYNST